MSDNYINIISKDPFFIPSDEAIKGIKGILIEIMPESEEIEIEMDDQVKFRDCGSNFEIITCPNCGEDIEIDSWQEMMDQDYDEEIEGFKLQKIGMPCCQDKCTLNELIYSFDQGFSRFMIGSMNPNKGELSKGEVSQLQKAFGCEIKVIYKHI